jgi:hypothetical protein
VDRGCRSRSSSFQGVLFGKDLDSLPQPTALYGYAEPEREIVYIDTAIGRQQGRLGEDPEMTAAPRLFQSRLNAVLFQLITQLKQVLHAAVIVRVDRHPLRALCPRMDRIEIDGMLAVHVGTDSGIVE